MSNKFIVEGGLSIPSGKQLELAGVGLAGISNDATLAGNAQDELVTEYAVKSYIDNNNQFTLSDGTNTTSIDASEVLLASDDNAMTITVSNNGIGFAIDVDDSSIETDASNGLQVKALGVTNAMLAGSIASTKLAELNNFDTGDVSEGSNLYYTTARWDTKMAAADTGDLSEGSNQYYTDARVHAAVSVADSNSIDMTYDGSGEFTADAKVDDSSIETDASNGLQVKALGVTNAMLAGSVASTKIAELNNFDTGDVSEGSNLYYTDERVDDRVNALISDSDGLTGTYDDASGSYTLAVNVDDSSLEITADDLNIKALGVTNAMLAGSIANGKLANDSVTVSSGTGLSGGGEVDLGSSLSLSVDASQTQITEIGTITTGTWTATPITKAYIGADAIDGTKIGDSSINSEHFVDGSIDNEHIADGAIDNAAIAADADIASTKIAELNNFDTGDVSEGSNLYYTTARWDTKMAAADTGDLTEGSNLYYTTARWDTKMAAADTGDLTEGANLYYTTARWDTKMAAADTGDLTEGSNLYYTDERVDDRVNALISDSDGLTGTYDDASGSYTLAVNVDDSSLEITSDDLNVKALGITNAMLAGSIANGKLANDSVTVSSGTGMSGGGEVDLGSSLSLSVDATQAQITGIGTSGQMTTFAGTVNVDEAVTLDTTLGVTGVATFTAEPVFNSGIDCNGVLDMAGNNIEGSSDDMLIQSGTGLTDYTWSSNTGHLALQAENEVVIDSAVRRKSDFSITATGGDDTCFEFDGTSFQSCKVVVRHSDGSDTTAKELLVVCDANGANPAFVEYGTVNTDSELTNTWAVSDSSGTITVSCTGSSSDTIKGSFELLR